MGSRLGLCAYAVPALALVAALGGCSRNCGEPAAPAAQERASAAESLERQPRGESGREPVPPASPQAAPAPPAQARPPLGDERRHAPEPDPLPSRSEPRRAESDWRLEHADPELRVEGVEALEPEGEGLRRLSHALRGDPSPVVRAAAAEQLEMSESSDAVRSLLAALDDPDPEVVMAVIEALEYVGDERIVPQLARHRNHPDPDVREALEDAIEFLE